MSARALLLCLAVSACQSPPPTPRPAGAVVARVEGRAITDEDVRATAAREAVDAPTALRMLVEEELLAREAARRGLAAPWVEEDARWHARVRRYLEAQVEAQVTLERSPRGAFDAFFASRRAAACHDGLRRVMHFVILSASDPRPAGAALRRADAERVRRAIVAEAGERPDLGAFQRVATRVGGDLLRLENLPAMDRRGGMLNGASVVAPFSEAVWRLSADAPMSPVFESSFGVHVALLLEETPSLGVSCESVRPELAREFVAIQRAAVARALVERLRARALVRVDHAALQASAGSSNR